MGDIVDSKSQRLLEFDDAKRWLCVPPNYSFIWQNLQSINLLLRCLLMKIDQLWIDWCLKGGTIFNGEY